MSIINCYSYGLFPFLFLSLPLSAGEVITDFAEFFAVDDSQLGVENTHMQINGTNWEVDSR